MESADETGGAGKNADVRELKKLSKAEKVLQDAEKQTTLQLSISNEAEKESKSDTLIASSTNLSGVEVNYTDSQYDFYYPKFSKFKRKYLKGRLYKGVREEINLYLRRGRRGGSDCRQAHPNLFKQAWAIALEWLVEFNGTQVFELHRKFKQLNNPNMSLFSDEEEGRE